MMKNIIRCIVVIIISTICYLWYDNKKPDEILVDSPSQRSENKAIIIDQEEVEESRRKWEENRAVEIKNLIRMANVPIDFWGKVVDQNGQPLKSVKITYRIQKPRAPWSTNSLVDLVETDVDGSFHVKNKGSTFGIEAIEKQGYKMAACSHMSFTYSDNPERYVPDPNKPKIYTLIKEDDIQGLIVGDRQILLDWDGVPVYYDLEKGRLGKFGEIKITAERGEIRGAGQQARYDWSFKVEVPHGGILEIAQEYSFLAPMEGYKTSWQYGFLASDSEWATRKKGVTHLIFKLPNGNYGKLHMDFTSEPGSRLSGRIYSYLNPTGGRLLEYEARLKIK